VRPQLRRNGRQDDRLHDVRPELLVGDAGIVLGRDHDVGHALGHAALVLDGDLSLAVGSQVGQLAALANLGQAASQPMGQRDRQRHQLRRLAQGKSDHHPLVAGTELTTLADALGDVRRLLLDADQRAAGLVVEPVLGVGVARSP